MLPVYATLPQRTNNATTLYAHTLISLRAFKYSRTRVQGVRRTRSKFVNLQGRGNARVKIRRFVVVHAVLTRRPRTPLAVLSIVVALWTERILCYRSIPVTTRTALQVFRDPVHAHHVERPVQHSAI